MRLRAARPRPPRREDLKSPGGRLLPRPRPARSTEHGFHRKFNENGETKRNYSILYIRDVLSLSSFGMCRESLNGSTFPQFSLKSAL